MKTKVITTSMIPMFLANIFTVAFVVTLTAASPTIVIDGVISSGEWDAYHLGASVTSWGGGMSIDVYGYADGTYLYVAYVADKEQPGWAIAESLAVDCNFYTSTVEDSNLLDTIFQMWATGESYQVQRTADWVTWDDIGTLETAGVEYYYISMWDSPDNQGVAELKIPLSLIIIDGATQIELYGQYWQYDWADLFYVELPPPLWVKASGGGEFYDDYPDFTGHHCTIGLIGISLSAVPQGTTTDYKGSGVFVDHDLKFVVNLDVTSGRLTLTAKKEVQFWGTTRVKDIEGHDKWTGTFWIGLVDDAYGVTNRFALHLWRDGVGKFGVWHGTLLPESEVTVWVWE